MNFVEMVNGYAATLHPDTPPLAVAHPNYGKLGDVTASGFMPEKNHWSSTHAILRDSNRATVQTLRRFEDTFIGFGDKVARWLERNPMGTPIALQAISNYDGIVTARGSGALQDVWMAMTATQTPVTLSWYDLMAFANWQPMTAPNFAAYTNGGTGGAVLDATSNGSWLTNPTGSNKKYIVSVGLTTTSITGFATAMLYDCLWAGTYSINASATINPTTDVTVTRYASTSAGNADYSGGNQMMSTLTATLTYASTAGSVATTYTDQAGTTGKTTSYTFPATGPLVNRVIGNHTHATATPLANTPFMALTNAGSSGVTKLEQVVVTAAATPTSGSVVHKIVRPLVFMPFIAANSYIEQDTTLNIGNMVELRNASQVCGCLGWNAFSAGTTAASISAFLRTVEG